MQAPSHLELVDDTWRHTARIQRQNLSHVRTEGWPFWNRSGKPVNSPAEEAHDFSELHGRRQKLRLGHSLNSSQVIRRQRRRLHSCRPVDMLKLKAKSANFNSGNLSVAIAAVAMLWCHRIHLYFVLRGSSAQAWYSRAASAVSSRLLLSDREQKLLDNELNWTSHQEDWYH